MNLLEVLRILQTVGRRWKNPSDNPLTLWQMASYYVQKKAYLSRHRLPAIQVPFAYDVEEVSPSSRIAVVTHGYYPELMPELLDHIRQIPFPYKLYVSTDTEDKRKALISLIGERQMGEVDVRVAPNRGRDMAPKFITFRDAYERCDIFLHLHTKKSPQTGPWGDAWRRYLLGTLLGSPEIIRSNLRVLADERIGLVFPEPLNDTIPFLRWGSNFNASRELAGRLNCDINPGYCSDYPDGGMFWGKSSAIRSLLDLRLNFEDFAVEKGQVDGELNHAIERMVAQSALKVGLSSCRVRTGETAERLLVVENEQAVESTISICLVAQEEERTKCDRPDWKSRRPNGS